jgi:hypothetical protein
MLQASEEHATAASCMIQCLHKTSGNAAKIATQFTPSRLCFTHRGLESARVELTILMFFLNRAEAVETCVRKARGFLERSRDRSRRLSGLNSFR